MASPVTPGQTAVTNAIAPVPRTGLNGAPAPFTPATPSAMMSARIAGRPMMGGRPFFGSGMPLPQQTMYPMQSMYGQSPNTFAIGDQQEGFYNPLTPRAQGTIRGDIYSGGGGYPPSSRMGLFGPLPGGGPTGIRAPGYVSPLTHAAYQAAYAQKHPAAPKPVTTPATTTAPATPVAPLTPAQFHKYA